MDMFKKVEEIKRVASEEFNHRIFRAKDSLAKDIQEDITSASEAGRDSIYYYYSYCDISYNRTPEFFAIRQFIMPELKKAGYKVKIKFFLQDRKQRIMITWK